jgi:hypothetical protein
MTLILVPPHNPILGYRETYRKLVAVGCASDRPALMVANWQDVGAVLGGATTFLGALQQCCDLFLLPSFTPQTCLAPNTETALLDVEFWQPDLPADPALGPLPELARQLPTVRRSDHPCLSFLGVGVRAAAALATQSLADPYAPLRWLAEHDGLLLLLGVTPAECIVSSYAAQRAGHPSGSTFAMLPGKIVPVTGLATEFHWTDLTNHLNYLTRSVPYGGTTLSSYPLCKFILAVETAYHQQVGISQR